MQYQCYFTWDMKDTSMNYIIIADVHQFPRWGPNLVHLNPECKNHFFGRDIRIIASFSAENFRFCWFIYVLKVLFKIIGQVNIFPHNFAISGAILLIFWYIAEIGERHILCYLILKIKQSGAWKMKKKNTTSTVFYLCTQNAYQWNHLS